ncbi:MAG: hypothetical protein ACLR8P_13730 [Clostridium fessum]
MSDKKLTEMEIFTSALYNALGVGYKNAQTRRSCASGLDAAIGCSARGVEILRLDYAILTRDDGKGYYLPETTDAGRADAKRWSKRQDRRVQAIRAAQAGALKFATGWKEPKGIYGQISMFRDGGQDGEDAERERKARRA